MASNKAVKGNNEGDCNGQAVRTVRTRWCSPYFVRTVRIGALLDFAREKSFDEIFNVDDATWGWDACREHQVRLIWSITIGSSNRPPNIVESKDGDSSQ